MDDPLVFSSVVLTPSSGSLASDVCKQSTASDESTSINCSAVMSSEETPHNVIDDSPTPSSLKSDCGIIQKNKNQSEATKPIKVLLVGGNNTVECWPTSEISDNRLVCTAFSQKDSSLATLIHLAKRNLSNDTELLVMDAFAQDLLYEDKTGFLFAHTKKDLRFIQTLVDHAIKFWRIHYPNLNVIWVLPHLVNLVQYNLSKITAEDKTEVVKRSAEATILYERNVSQLRAKLEKSECFLNVFDSRAFDFESTLSDGIQLSVDSMKTFVSKLGFLMVNVIENNSSHLKMHQQHEKNMRELKATRNQEFFNESIKKKVSGRSFHYMSSDREASDSQKNSSKRQRLDCKSSSSVKENSFEKMPKYKQSVIRDKSCQVMLGHQQNAEANRFDGRANEQLDIVQIVKQCATKISTVYKQYLNIRDKFADDCLLHPDFSYQWKSWRRLHAATQAHAKGADVNVENTFSLWQKDWKKFLVTMLNKDFSRSKRAIVKKHFNSLKHFEIFCKLHKIQYIEDQKIPVDFCDLVITSERGSNHSTCSLLSNSNSIDQEYNPLPTGSGLSGNAVPPHSVPARTNSSIQPVCLSSLSPSLVHPTIMQPSRLSSQLPVTLSCSPTDSRLTSRPFTHAGPSNTTVELRSLSECFSLRHSLDHSSHTLPYQRDFQPSETKPFDAVNCGVTSTTSVGTNIIAIDPRSLSDQFSVSTSSEEQSVKRDVVECLKKLHNINNLFFDSMSNITEMLADAVNAEVLSENPMNIFNRNAKHILGLKKVFDSVQKIMNTKFVSSNVTNCYNELCWLLDEIRKNEFCGIDVFKLAKETEEFPTHIVLQKLNHLLQNARICVKVHPEVKIFLHDLVCALHERAIQDRIKKVVSKLHKSAAVDSRQIIDQHMNSKPHVS